MFNEKQKDAIRKWYHRAEVIDEARRLVETKQWDELEELIHMHALMPLRRFSELPDYLKDEKGEPLIPSGCAPHRSQDDWNDALETGWEVISEVLGVDQGAVNRAIKENEDRNWEEFIRRADERKREREGK